MSLTAFTKIIVTVAITAWVFILPVEAVATILVLELALLLYIKHDRMTMAAIGGLAVFTGMMILLQLLFGSPLAVALIGGLRMLVMTMAFLCLLAATRIQDIAKALVERFHMPCEYAFMLTTALRFVPNFLTDSETLQVEGVEVACVSGSFPSSQALIEVKVAETALALKDGATEIDMVMSVGAFLSEDYETVCDEISELKAVCGERKLKVILETGLLPSASAIKKASLLAMYAGADYIKTSTGKEKPAATPEAAYVMCPDGTIDW